MRDTCCWDPHIYQKLDASHPRSTVISTNERRALLAIIKAYTYVHIRSGLATSYKTSTRFIPLEVINPAETARAVYLLTRPDINYTEQPVKFMRVPGYPGFRQRLEGNPCQPSVSGTRPFLRFQFRRAIIATQRSSISYAARNSHD